MACLAHFLGPGPQAQLRRCAAGCWLLRAAQRPSKVEHPREVFYAVKKYISKFGDPKGTKARVVSLKIRGKGMVKGVIVREEEEGVFPIRRSTHIDFEREYVLDDGSVVLDDQQMNDMLEVGSELDDEDGGKAVMEDSEWAGVPSGGILSIEETAKRAQAAGLEKAGAGEDDSSDSGDSSRSGDASEASSSDSRSAKSDDEVGTIAPKAKRAKTEGSIPATPRAKGTASQRAAESEKKSTPPRGAGAGAAAAADEEGEAGEKDIEAEALIGTLMTVCSNFSAGAFAGKEGRAGQELQRTWKGRRP